MASSGGSAILEEIEALEAIMPEEIIVDNNESGLPCSIEVCVVPATAEVIDEQHVRVTVHLSLSQEYPDISPVVELRNPRGIDDDVLETMKYDIVKKCEDFVGFPVIYEIVEVVREHLTANNTPSCPCAICLFRFTENDTFTKTQCFHYFHSYCLGRYMTIYEEEAAEEEPQPSWAVKEVKLIVCPVCRIPLGEKLYSESLISCDPPEESITYPDFVIDDPKIRELQERMSAIYLHQKSIGGIIDVEEEKNKFLISTDLESPIQPTLHTMPSVSKMCKPSRGGFHSSHSGRSCRGRVFYLSKSASCSRGRGPESPCSARGRAVHSNAQNYDKLQRDCISKNYVADGVKRYGFRGRGHSTGRRGRRSQENVSSLSKNSQHFSTS